MGGTNRVVLADRGYHDYSALRCQYLRTYSWATTSIELGSRRKHLHQHFSGDILHYFLWAYVRFDSWSSVDRQAVTGGGLDW